MFYDFEAIKASTDILKVGQDLGLELKKSGAGFRSPCPACQTDNLRGLVITPGKGFYCFGWGRGGNVMHLVCHMLGLGDKQNPEVKAAAEWLTEQYQLGTGTDDSTDTGTSTIRKDRATLPPEQTREPTRASRPFDPAEFWAKCQYNDEVEKLGYSQEDAERLLIGWHVQRKAVYIGHRNPDGSTSGFSKLVGTLSPPPRWIVPQDAKVVRLVPKSA